jgi:CheY-like chemotaxis protein
MLPRIFEIFMQVDRPLERIRGGLGIGLTLVRRLIEMHGGSVQAYSKGPGQGSEFTVRLPVAIGPPPGLPLTSPESKRTVPIASLRILIVDDNRDSAASLGMLLQLLGNDIRTAHDGLEALGMASDFRPEVVILDIGLPKMNGYDVAQRIRQQSWGKEIILIAMTGWGQEEDKRRSREAGFDHHLVKPLDPAVLMNLLALLAYGT